MGLDRLFVFCLCVVLFLLLFYFIYLGGCRLLLAMRFFYCVLSLCLADGFILILFGLFTDHFLLIKIIFNYSYPYMFRVHQSINILGLLKIIALHTHILNWRIIKSFPIQRSAILLTVSKWRIQKLAQNYLGRIGLFKKKYK